jgi:hypothetical protein
VVVVTGRGAAAGSLTLIFMLGAVVAVVGLGRSGSAGRPGVAG